MNWNFLKLKVGNLNTDGRLKIYCSLILSKTIRFDADRVGVSVLFPNHRHITHYLLQGYWSHTPYMYCAFPHHVHRGFLGFWSYSEASLLVSHFALVFLPSFLSSCSTERCHTCHPMCGGISHQLMAIMLILYKAPMETFWKIYQEVFLSPLQT